MCYRFCLLDCEFCVNKHGNTGKKTGLEWAFGYHKSHKVCALLEPFLAFKLKISEGQLSDAVRCSKIPLEQDEKSLGRCSVSSGEESSQN